MNKLIAVGSNPNVVFPIMEVERKEFDAVVKQAPDLRGVPVCFCETEDNILVWPLLLPGWKVEAA